MGRSIQWSRLALTSVVTMAGFGVSQPARPADDGPRAQSTADEKTQAKTAAGDRRKTLAEFFSQPGDDTPRPSVPLRPATVDDRRRLEATRLYTAARSLEDQGKWSDAVDLLQQASKLDPDSVAIARRLAKIYIGAFGRPELATQYGRRVLSIEPNDTEILARLVEFYIKRGEPESAEALLKEVLANPKLPAHAPGRLVAEFELGRIYATRLKRLDKAAEAFAHVIENLDDRSANRLTPAEMARILGNDPASAYLSFGMIFLEAKRDDLVVKALERGLVYDEDNPQIALLLAEALQRLRKPERALELVDRVIRRQPQGVDVYDLMAKVLKAMGREREITPRLEDAAQRDSKNVPLQYVLADRYRETGQAEKAEALYKALLTSQPTPLTYRALATSLFKRKKVAELLKVFCDAWNQRDTQTAIKPLAESVARDDELAGSMLDVGTEQLSAGPPTLPPVAFKVLAYIAGSEGGAAKPPRMEKLLKLQRLELAGSPSPLVYSEIADTLRRLSRYADAASTVEELIAKYPAQRTVITLVFLADTQRRAGKLDAAKAALAEAEKLDAHDAESLMRLAFGFRDLGRIEDAARVIRDISKREPNNPIYDLTLGEILSRFGRNEEAIKVYEDVLKRFGDNDEVVKLARGGLSVVYVNMGNFIKGEAELEILLQRNPDDATPNNDLGYLYAEQGKNLERAEEMIQKALREEPNNAAYLDSMGWVLFKQGKYKESLVSMRRAAERVIVERGEPDNTILEHLGDVYFQLQDVAKAEESWRQALKVAEDAVPPDKRAGELRKKLDALKKLGPKPRAAASPSP
jgi:tetratricopeptide (TPR) repeat protein